MIELAGFSYARDGREILHDLSFVIARRERVAILGPNGAGKTTLLNCIKRILRGGRGRIAVGGRPLADYRQAELARQIAFVPQADGRTAPFTVHEFVEMSRYPHLGPLAHARPEDAAAVRQALDDLGIGALARRPLDALSGGERQKAFLAAALAQEAEILLLDEPTAHLDPPHRAEILRTLARVHGERELTILFVTHDINEALAAADRVLGLRDGVLAFDGPACRLTEGAALRAVFSHDFLVAPHPRTGRAMVFPE